MLREDEVTSGKEMGMHMTWDGMWLCGKTFAAMHTARVWCFEKKQWPQKRVALLEGSVSL